MKKDQFGRTIRKSDIITYPVRQGSSMWMKHGEVVGFEKDWFRNDYKLNVNTNDINGKQRKCVVEALERVTIVGRSGQLNEL